MSTITFQSKDIDTKIIKCKLEDKIEDVCRRYAKEINKAIDRLEFFLNDKELNKSMTVKEFNRSNPQKKIFVDIFFYHEESDNDEISFPNGGISFDINPKSVININNLFKNIIPSIQEKIFNILLNECKLTPDMLDERGNKNPSEWPKNPQKRGGYTYYPPTYNWIGFGLKVWDEYDNGNNDWIAKDSNPNEWAIAYHGTSASAVRPICIKDRKFYSSMKEGAIRQKLRDLININPKSKNLYQICGEGAYSCPSFEYASNYSKFFNIGVIIMCRVNPSKIRIPQGKYEETDWLTDGTRNTIRPYRILIELNN